MTDEWAEFQWFASDDGQRQLAELASIDMPLPSQVTRLRKQYSPERTHLLLEQVELRKKAREKFTQPERMLFTPRALEQATDEWVASYKVSRFPMQQSVADLCCGIGGDLLALGRHGKAVGVDRDPLMSWLARHNSGQLTLAADACEVDLANVQAWHIDPDRRPNERRTTRVVDHQPGSEAIERMLRQNPNGAIKLAPAAEWPDSWSSQAEFEWISRDRQCRQLVAWFGALAHQHSQRTATVLDARGGVLDTVSGTHEQMMPDTRDIGRWLFEPDPAVIAARLTGALATLEDLQPIARDIAYLTGDRLVSRGSLAAFEVLDALPYDGKRLKAWLLARDALCVEVKKRGVDLDPAKVARQLRVSGTQKVTLVLLPIAGRVTAVMTSRIIKESSP